MKKSKLVEELEYYGFGESEATKTTLEALELIKKDDKDLIPQVIDMVGEELAKRLYTYHRYYAHAEGLYDTAQEFDAFVGKRIVNMDKSAFFIPCPIL